MEAHLALPGRRLAQGVDHALHGVARGGVLHDRGTDHAAHPRQIVEDRVRVVHARQPGADERLRVAPAHVGRVSVDRHVHGGQRLRAVQRDRGAQGADGGRAEHRPYRPLAEHLAGHVLCPAGVAAVVVRDEGEPVAGVVAGVVLRHGEPGAALVGDADGALIARQGGVQGDGVGGRAR